MLSIAAAKSFRNFNAEESWVISIHDIYTVAIIRSDRKISRAIAIFAPTNNANGFGYSRANLVYVRALVASIREARDK